MSWVPIAVLMMLGETAKALYFSRAELRPFSSIFKAWANVTGALPASLVLLAFTGMPVIQPHFWPWVLLQAVLLSVAFTLMMRAYEVGVLSRIQPLMGLDILILAVITSPFLLHEHVTYIGWAGVALVVAGTYLTQHPGKDPVTGGSYGLFAPFRVMVTQPGGLAMLGVLLIFSVTSNIDKICAQASNTPFYLVVIYVLVSVILGAVMLLTRRFPKPVPGVSRVGVVLIGGSTNALSVIPYVWALGMGLAITEVMVVKRASLLLIAAWALFIRKESGNKLYRMIGTVLVVVGVSTVLLYGK